MRIGKATDLTEAVGEHSARHAVGAKKPPRVQLVVSGVYPPDFGGGQLRVHKTLLRMRGRYSMEVEVLALTGTSTSPEWSETDGITVRRLSACLGPLALVRAVGGHLISARRRGIELVYIIATGRLAYIAGLWAKLLGIPLMIEIMNCNLHETVARRLVARPYTRAASLAIAISEPVARELRAFGVSADRLWIRPNPVDIERHKLPSAVERSREKLRLGYADAEVLHVVAGGIEPRKNQLFAVDAVEQLGDEHRLLMVGPVLPHDVSYVGRVRSRVAASPARDRIRLVDHFTNELHRVMYAADCLWMPSLEEGLGNVMLEALCCGVPCVINQALGMDEHIQDGVNGRQAPLDPLAWAAAVETITPLIRDPNRRVAISAAARNRYDAAKFDAEFYRRVLALVRPGDGTK